MNFKFKHKLFLLVRNHSTRKLLPYKALISPAYQPALVEKDKYENWEKKNLFVANNNEKDAPVFSMVLPPPNVTGKLHLGHALSGVIQDVIVRREKLRGANVLWLPGTDHAGIATQGVVEKYLASSHNVTRHAIGRDAFNQHVLRWKEEYGDNICSQLRRLGFSLDWSRFVFTMDDRHTASVNQAFVRLFDKGLIYRKKALVNWCVALKSVISDFEVETIEIDGPTDITVPGYDKPIRFGLITELDYRLSEDEVITVATTRLETMLGDVAIAVHPDDQRYAHLHGKMALHPIGDRRIPVIADSSVDMSFGTGAVKVTPSHDRTDYEIAVKHNLPMLEVINEDGLIREGFQEFSGMKRYDCRVALETKLTQMGLVRSVRAHKMVLPVCSRSGDVIELMPKHQWFLNCKELARKAKAAVESGRLRIYPDNYVRNWLTWASDERDWCISRQLWWGHRIPAYKVKDSDVWVAAMSEEEAKLKAGNNSTEMCLERDTDVLDTWFSSGIYPFSSLGWPARTRDYEKFYPLSLMVTGHDILGFWVYRMVILGEELTGRLPFDKVLLHGVICDSRGAKMSKSRGNVLDPVDVISGISLKELQNKFKRSYECGVLNKTEFDKAITYTKSNYPKGIPECGVDALRLTLLSKDIKSNFVHFDLDQCHANKLFGNKLWQSVKYCQISSEKLASNNTEVTLDDLSVFDRWILSRLANMAAAYNLSFDTYDFFVAVRALKQFLYNDFCDFYLETTKLGFESDSKVSSAHLHTISAVLNAGLRHLNPFMVYLTEELLDKIPNVEDNIIYNFKPLELGLDFAAFDKWIDVHLESKMSNFINLVDLVRQLKGFYTIPNKIKPKVIIENCDTDLKEIVSNNRQVFNFITRTQGVDFKMKNPIENSISGILSDKCFITLELPDNFDAKTAIKTAKAKLDTRLLKTNENLKRLNEKVLNKGYVEKTPEVDKMADYERLKILEEELRNLKKLASL